MSTCVRRQAAIWRDRLEPGDVIVSNHPEYGGTHLPDITVITPAFSNNTILFYVASRAHHADIGGILPGSMPPHSRELFQEGAAIASEKLVSKGTFNESRMIELLHTDPARHPGCSGTRCLADNLNDLKAQIAANQKGINLIRSLISDYTSPVVQFYMLHIQQNAALAVRDLLRSMHNLHGKKDLFALDHMDDGSPIALHITISPEAGSATFDFTGTGPEVYANTNAPPAITYSAIIYALRSLIRADIPLNQGCLEPIRVIIPRASFLRPSATAAVVGGNVLTSQRITDVILRAFSACAASQGCCNNLTFGFGSNAVGETEVRGFGYYETIAGGAGAGPSWKGASGVHTHMTNTRITDAEVFERRYPVVLREFAIRKGSGGKGRFMGGDGVVRDIEFRTRVLVSILSERRVFRPYGMEGGGEGMAGLNVWVRKVLAGAGAGAGAGEGETFEERRVNLGGKNTADMKPGERIIVMTPGGGAWGAVEESNVVDVVDTAGGGGCDGEEEGQDGPGWRDPRAAWKGGSVASRAVAETSA